MATRPTHQINFVRAKDPIPSVEVDLDAIPEHLHGFGDIVAQALCRAAQANKGLRATIHVYHSGSVNFGSPTASAFFGVAGAKKVLDVLLYAFKAAKVSRVRFSDYIAPAPYTRQYHVEDGEVWEILDAASWQTITAPAVAVAASNAAASPATDDGEDEDEEIVVLKKKRRVEIADEMEEDADWEAEDEDEDEDDEDDEDEEDEDEDEETGEGETGRALKPLRYKAARSDASVKAIRRAIEKIFGLPEGSVALCGPDGKPLRANARIATLRKRWDKA